MESTTFRERVVEFWDWFPTVADSIGEVIQSGNAVDGLQEFIEDVREKVGGLAWVFGPGESEGRLSFTVTGEGQVAKQLLTHFWLENAVEVTGWDFYSSRQPSPASDLEGMSIDVGEQSVDVKTLLIATEVDEENESVHIKAWHEVFENVEEGGRFQILFLLLDEALGEYGTQTKLGNIEFKSDLDAKPLMELPGFLEQLWEEKGWDELSPLETYSGYQGNPTNEFPRADTIAGFTCVPQVVLAYLNGRGSLDEDPIEGTGAEFIYVQLNGAGANHQDDALELRGQIEEEISKRLNGGGGYVVGGATGTEDCYIDLVIFDGERSRAAIREALEESTWNGDHGIKKFFD